MINSTLNDISIKSALQKINGSHLDNDLLLLEEMAKLPFPQEPRRTNCLVIGLCLKGHANYTVDTICHIVSPNDFIIISPGQISDNYSVSNDFSGIGILLSENFFREVISGIHELASLFLFSRNHPVCTLQKEEADMLQQYFWLLKKKVNETGHHFRRDTIRMLITTIIYDLSNTIYLIQSNEHHKPSRAEKIFSDFIQLAQENFRKERRVGWYAKQMCISAKYLSEAVKSISHKTPAEWIDYYVTLELRILLKTTAKSIKEIAIDLNFSNQSFLGKYFKERVGMSPKEYRLS